MGGTKRFQYPVYVWSPAGGWWCNPRYWKRNTTIAFMAIGVLSAGVWYISAQLERRPVPPYRHIPSQRWCKYAKEDDPRLRTN